MLTPPALMQTIRQLPAAQFYATTRGLRADTVRDLREQFARWAYSAARRQQLATWQEAWNAFTGATQTNPGRIAVQPAVCPDCNGRRFSARTMQMCLNCYAGSRRPPAVTVLARWVEPPQAPRPPG
jgi:hypothetical protein